ncbi:uncharacterized protein LOC105841589 isoform X1 [Bombyx mori]|uniref:Uncharacterized protein n=2 Tax=Bombyx mori TaxID=7091 RepID=A0A8R2DK32_BOMMO|nr:uncharacterized protein LOC105841589 isoform X2 [Bombyx mori]
MSTLCVCCILCACLLFSWIWAFSSFFSVFRMSKRLAEQDIENILSVLENGDISEDEESIGDENDIDYYSNVQDLIQDLEDAEEDQYNANPDVPIEEDHLPDEFSVPGPSLSRPLSGVIGAAALRQRSRQLIWKKGNLEFSEDRISFTGSDICRKSMRNFD